MVRQAATVSEWGSVLPGSSGSQRRAWTSKSSLGLGDLWLLYINFCQSLAEGCPKLLIYQDVWSAKKALLIYAKSSGKEMQTRGSRKLVGAH